MSVEKGFTKENLDYYLKELTASSAMKEAVNVVGDRLGLPNGWLNADFKNTSSYTGT